MDEIHRARSMPVLHLQETEGLITFFALIALVFSDRLMRERVNDIALTQLFNLAGCLYCIQQIEGVLTLRTIYSWVNQRTRL